MKTPARFSSLIQNIRRTARGASHLLLLACAVFTMGSAFSASRTQAACDPINVVEAWISVFHLYQNGVENGYAMEFGLELDDVLDEPLIDTVKVTPTGKSPTTVPFDEDEYSYFDGLGFDGDTWTGSAYASQAAMEVPYPPGTYTFTIDVVEGGCADQTITATYDFDDFEPNGTIQTIYPAPGATINHKKPVIIGKNTCTNCTGVEGELFSSLDGAVSLSFEPDLDFIGNSPNTIPYAEFFGVFGSGNDGSGGDVSGGLPAAGYKLAAGIARSVDTTPTPTTSAGDSLNIYKDGYVFDLTTFTVGVETTTTADVNDAEIFIDELLSKPASLPLVELGFNVFVEVDGTNLNDATLYIPNLNPRAVPGGSGEYNLEEEGYGSRALALAEFPATDLYSRYVLMVDGGRSYAFLEFTPVEPSAGFPASAPADGSTTTQFPTFEANNACTNCGGIAFWVEDAATFGDTVDTGWMETDLVDPVATGPRSVDFVDFHDNDQDLIDNGLPDGDYFGSSETLNETVYLTGGPGALVFTPTSGADDAFNYWQGELKVDVFEFTVVPEPGLVGLQLAALACLGAVARSRRRS